MEYIKIDLLFKIVWGKMNVFLIIGWDNNSKYIYILCYAYTMYRLIYITGIKVWVYAFLNLETYAVYIKMFELVFKVLGNAARLFI